MPSEERDAEMLGRQVYHVQHHGMPSVVQSYSYLEEDAVETFYRREPSKIGITHDITPGRWHAEPVAVALVEAVEAARAYRAFAQPRQHTMTPETIAEWHRIKDALYGSLDNLDAALGRGRNG